MNVQPNIINIKTQITQNKPSFKAAPVTTANPAEQNPGNKHLLKEQVGSAVCASLGVATALALISKRQGFSLNPKRILNTRINDWAIFKITNKDKNNGKVLDFQAKEILTLGAGSVAGGLVAGAIYDKKENFKYKCYEAISQMIGDISIPLAFVAGPATIYKKFETLASKETKHLTLQKLAKTIDKNKFLRVMCPTVTTGIPLGLGILTGNKVSNWINGQLQGEEQQRGIRATDFAPHIDDVCMAVSIMAEKGPIPDIISKFVPVALTVAGIETSKAKPQKPTVEQKS